MSPSSRSGAPSAAAAAPGGDARALWSWAFYDWANNGFATVIQVFVFAAYFTEEVAGDPARGAAIWGHTLGLAGVVVALTGPLLGATADRGGRQKPWLLSFTLLAAVATAGLWFVRPRGEDLLLGAVLVALASIGAELACIFYNAMLPRLAPPGRIGRWSGWGWSLGYLGGLLCLLLVYQGFVRTGAWFDLDRGEAQHLRLTFPLVGAWLLLFALPLALFTPDAPSSGLRPRAALREGLSQLRTTVREVRRYRHLVRFLVARMLYIDGLATLMAFTGVYAAGTIGLDAEQVLVFAIAVNVMAGLGALGFSWLDDRIGGKRTTQWALLGLIVPAAAILLVPTRAAFWAGGLALGLFVGPVQAASRSYLARVAPPELENQAFGLEALSGKATAFIGPLLVGWLAALSGSQRTGMWAIVGLFVAGLAVLSTVPAEVEDRALAAAADEADDDGLPAVEGREVEGISPT